MKRTATLLAALAVATAANAAPVRTATEAYVTNKIAAAVAVLPAPDFTTNNTVLVETIEATAPAPGNYAAVSNAAMNAAERVRTGQSEWRAQAEGSSSRYPLRMESPTNWACRATYPRLGGPTITLTRNDIENSWTLEYGAPNGSTYNPATTNAPATVQTLYFTITVEGHEEMSGTNYTLFRTNETQGSSVAYLADIPQVVTNVITKSYVEGLGISSEEADPVWSADKPSYATHENVTAAIREQSLGGIWDAQLEVWWTPVMSNGALTYQATTNVNLNAEN